MNVLALLVTTSPTSPLPLVTALERVPFSYVSTIVSPSSFHERSASCPLSQSLNASLSLVLSSESIGLSCVSFGRLSTASYPTFTVGEPARSVPVFSSSIRSSS